MSLLKCPNEVLLIIGEDLPPSQRDMNALAQTCRRLFHLLNPSLYRCNTQHHQASALAWAVNRGLGNTVRNCLESGAPFNKTGHRIGSIGRRRCVLGCTLSEVAGRYYFHPQFYEQPISSAARYGHLDIVRVLLEYGVDPDCPNPAGHTPLCLAAKGGHLEIVRFLLVNGASPGLKNACTVFPLLHRTWRKVNRERLKIKYEEQLQLLQKWDRTKWVKLKTLLARAPDINHQVGVSSVTLPKLLD